MFDIKTMAIAATLAVAVSHVPEMHAQAACHAEACGKGGGALAEAEKQISDYIKDKRARIGVAITAGCHSATVNNGERYPLMSVFKLHGAIAALRKMERGGVSIDTLVSVSARQMRKDTYSPMLKEHGGGGSGIPMRRLLQFSVAESDNNACDIILEYAGGIDSVANEMRAIGLKDFSLTETEKSMQANPMDSYNNNSTPESVTRLLRMLYCSDILTGEYAACLKGILASTVTGADKIKAGLGSGMTLAHKTGTGFRLPDGTKTADNDAGVVTLPDGRMVFIAILVKDSKESDAGNAAIIAEITRMAVSAAMKDKCRSGCAEGAGGKAQACTQETIGK